MTDLDTSNEKHYECDLLGDYIRLRLEGKIDVDVLRQSTDQVIKLAESQKVYKMLDDIRDLDRTSVTLRLQTEAIGLLWRLRTFKKIALIYKDDEIGRLVHATLGTVHFSSKCHAFDNEIDAIAWLREE